MIIIESIDLMSANTALLPQWYDEFSSECVLPSRPLLLPHTTTTKGSSSSRRSLEHQPSTANRRRVPPPPREGAAELLRRSTEGRPSEVPNFENQIEGPADERPCPERLPSPARGRPAEGVLGRDEPRAALHHQGGLRLVARALGLQQAAWQRSLQVGAQPIGHLCGEVHARGAL